MTRGQWLAGVTGLAMLLVAAVAPGLHAQTGKRVFIEPLVTEDATPDNELELAPGWNRESGASDFNFEGSLEKQITRNISIEIGQAYDSVSRSREHSSEGWDGVEIMPKWMFFSSAEHETVFAIAADLFPSSGDPSAGAETHSRGGPRLMWEKGMGDLPDTLQWLRPIAIQNDMAYLPTWGGPQADEFVFNVALSYSLQYLADSGQALPMSLVTDGLSPFVEFNYDQVAIGRRENTPPDLRVTPGLAYMYGSYQISVGTQVALNQTASHNVQAAVLTLLVIDLDEIIPGAGWMPL